MIEKFHPKPLQAACSTFHRYNFRPEVDNDVISSVAVGCFSADANVKFGDFRSNGSRDIRGAVFVSNERTKEHD